MRLPYQRGDVLRGVLVYATGDTAASLIQGQLSLWRVLGMMLVGGAVYALEIPAWFRWIERRTARLSGLPRSLARTGLAQLYFNPLWIARHLLFIRLFDPAAGSVGPDLLRLGLLSFLANIPVSLAANYIIQNRIPLRWRFLSSAVFSGLLAVYYSLSPTIFGRGESPAGPAVSRGGGER